MHIQGRVNLAEDPVSNESLIETEMSVKMIDGPKERESEMKMLDHIFKEGKADRAKP